MAGSIKGITIELNGNATPLNKAIRSVSATTKELQRELRGVETLLKMNPGNVDLLRQKEELLNSSIAETKSKLETLRAAKAAADQAMANGTEVNEAEYRNLQREIVYTEGRLNGLNDELRHFGSVGAQQIKVVGGKITDMGNKMRGFSMACAAATGALAGVTYKAGQFADDINTMSKVTGIGTEDLQRMYYTTELLDVSLDTYAGSMKKLSKAMYSANGGSKSTAEAFEALGVSITDNNGNLRNSQETFYDIIDALGGMTNETERDALAQKIFGKSAAALNPLIEAGSDALREYSESAHIMSQEQLDAANEFNDAVDTMKVAAKSALFEIGAKLAAAVLPYMEKMVNAVKSFAEKIAGINPKILLFVGTITALGAALSPVLIVMGATVNSIGSLVGAFKALKALAVAAMFSGIAAPIAGVVAAVGALAAIFVYCWKNVDGFKEGIINAFTQLRAAVAPALNSLQGAIAQLLPVLGNGIKKLLEALAPALSVVAQGISGLLSAVLPAIITAIHSIVAVIESLLPVIMAIIDAVLPIIQNAISAASNVLKSIIDVLKGIVTFLTGVFTGNWSQAWNGIKAIFSGVIETIKSVLSGLGAFISGVLGVVKSLFVTAGKAILAAFSDALIRIKSAWSTIKSFFANLISNIVAKFKSLIGKMTSIGSDIVHGIWSGISGAADWLLDKIKSWCGSILNGIKGFFGINSPSKVMEREVGQYIVPGLAAGIYKTADTATDAMKKVSQDILSEAESVLDIQESLGEISEEQTLSYWREIRKTTGIQGDELLKIDKKIADAEKAVLKKQQDERDKVLAEEEKRIEEYEKRVSSIANFKGIFDTASFERKSCKELTAALISQVNAIEEYGELMSSLAKRGISSELYEELKKQGVSALAELNALNRMNDYELGRYNELFLERNKAATAAVAAEDGTLSNFAASLSTAGAELAATAQTFNESAQVVVANSQQSQTDLIDRISTKAAEYVAQALLSGMAGVQNAILASMPQELNLVLDGKKMAQAQWSAFADEGSRRNRLFAPSRQEIANIAVSVKG